MTAAEQPGWIERLDELHLLTPLRVLLMILVAYVLTLIVRSMVRKFVRRTMVLPGTDPSRAEARQRAVGSALRGALIGIIWTVAFITIISTIGINIGAFVATATVVGGAVAFGAQQLIRDVISGFFVLAEDQYGVGDIVDVGHATGTVERITLRSVRLRDGVGAIWHVPHGGVLRAANLTKAPLAILDFEVARSTPLAVLEQEAAALCAALAGDAESASRLTAAPTAVGIINATDDRYVYRLTVDTQPGAHDAVRRRWRYLALQAFEAGQLSAPSLAAPIVHVNTVPPPAEEE
ncbi:MAG: mechanosensitive ion channel family protein [Ilumatobacteraceae bacterium]